MKALAAGRAARRPIDAGHERRGTTRPNGRPNGRPTGRPYGDSDTPPGKTHSRPAVITT